LAVRKRNWFASRKKEEGRSEKTLTRKGMGKEHQHEKEAAQSPQDSFIRG